MVELESVSVALLRRFGGFAFQTNLPPLPLCGPFPDLIIWSAQINCFPKLPSKVSLSQKQTCLLHSSLTWEQNLIPILLLRWRERQIRARESRHIYLWESQSSTYTKSTPMARWLWRTSTSTSTRVRSPPSSVTTERGRQRQCKRMMAFQ